MSKPDIDRHGIQIIRCAHCGRRITWWLGMRWKHAAGGSKPQPKCVNPMPARN